MGFEDVYMSHVIRIAIINEWSGSVLLIAHARANTICIMQSIMSNVTSVDHSTIYDIYVQVARRRWVFVLRLVTKMTYFYHDR